MTGNMSGESGEPEVDQLTLRAYEVTKRWETVQLAVKLLGAALLLGVAEPSLGGIATIVSAMAGLDPDVRITLDSSLRVNVGLTLALSTAVGHAALSSRKSRRLERENLELKARLESSE